MKVIYTYKKIKGTSRYEKSNEFTVNHAWSQETDKGMCGFDWKESWNVIGEPLEENEETFKLMVTCKKCRKKLGLE